MPERKSTIFTQEFAEQINQVVGFYDNSLPLINLSLWNKRQVWKKQAGAADTPPSWNQLMHTLPNNFKAHLMRVLGDIIWESQDPNVGTLRNPQELTMLTPEAQEFILASFADRRNPGG